MNFSNTSNIFSLIKELSPLQRMVNSEGIDKAFNIIKKNYLKKSIIHKYSSGLQIEDWIVPKRWKLKSAYLKSSKGEIIASSKMNKLFVAPYSESIDGYFSIKEISNHLFTRKDRPKSFLLEHRNRPTHIS